MLAAAVFSMKNEQHMYGRQLEPSARCRAGTPRLPVTLVIALSPCA